MKPILRHVARCVIAGIIAVLPVGGTVLTLLYVEDTLAESWLARQPFYFPGMGILAAIVLVYVLGLIITSFLGKWVWRGVDALLARLPLLGGLYKTLKQILGYGKGEDAVFKQVVLLESPIAGAQELGLVTNRMVSREGAEQLLVFVPGSPNPTSGKLVMADPKSVRNLDVSVHAALKSLVSAGASTPSD